jgi:hypothetical protein
MMSERALVTAIFKTALEGCEADVNARRNALWISGITLLADWLLCADPLIRTAIVSSLSCRIGVGSPCLWEISRGCVLMVCN